MAHTAGYAYRCRDPEAGGGGEAVDDILLEDDESGADEADARHNLGGKTGRVVSRDGDQVCDFVIAVGRNDGDERAAQGYQEVGAEAGLFSPLLPLYADDAAKGAADKDSYNKFVRQTNVRSCLSNKCAIHQK